MPKSTVPKALCVRCKSTVTTRCKAISCDGCSRWTHIKCEPKISTELYALLTEIDDSPLKYSCSNCRSKPTGPLNNAPVTVAQSSESLVLSKTQQDIPCSSRLTTPIAPATVGNKPLDRPELLTGPEPLSKNSISATQISTVPHKSVGTGTGSSPLTSRTRKNTIIAWKLPECESDSLEARETGNLDQWNTLCNQLGVQSSPPVGLVRLGRASHTRPLRVDLANAAEAEEVMLASSVLVATQQETRISPDLPWGLRQVRKLARETDPEAHRKRAVIIHGVPEVHDPDPSACNKHDRGQWNYLRTKLGLTAEDVQACSIARLPRPSHLSGIRAPRLLRVMLVTDEMASTLLTSWDLERNRFPQDLRIHPDRPRQQRQAIRGTPTASSNVAVLTDTLPLAISHSDGLTPEELPTLISPKNASMPAIRPA